MLTAQPQDTRNYFMLPQAPEEAGYYVYGTPEKGAAQYAHPKLMTLILNVERQWLAIENRKFGVGNISMAGGVKFGHVSHRKGLEVDIRPIRKDGLQLPVSYFESSYDRRATIELILLFRLSTPGRMTIFFNDYAIPGVSHLARHDNHFHLQCY